MPHFSSYSSTYPPSPAAGPHSQVIPTGYGWNMQTVSPLSPSVYSSSDMQFTEELVFDLSNT